MLFLEGYLNLRQAFALPISELHNFKLSFHNPHLSDSKS